MCKKKIEENHYKWHLYLVVAHHLVCSIVVTRTQQQSRVLLFWHKLTTFPPSRDLYNLCCCSTSFDIFSKCTLYCIYYILCIVLYVHICSYCDYCYLKLLLCLKTIYSMGNDYCLRTYTLESWCYFIACTRYLLVYRV